MRGGWRWGLLVAWVAVLVVQGGPITAADPGSSGPVQDGLGAVVLIGILVTIVGALAGWQLTAEASLLTATAGVVTSALDIGRVAIIAAVELAMYGGLLLVSLEAHRHRDTIGEPPGERAGRPALEAPGVEAALRRRMVRAGVVTAAGVVAVAAFGVVVSRVETRADRLAHYGAHVEGVVISYTPETRFAQAAVTVTYRYHEGAYRRRIFLADGSPVYRAGDRIVVDVDRDHPTTVSTGGSDNQRPVATWGLIAALLGGGSATVFGAQAVGRLRVARSILAARPWEPASFTHHRLFVGNRGRNLVRIHQAGRPDVVVTCPVARFNTNHGQACGNGARHVVLRARDSADIVVTVQPRTAAGRARLERLFDQGHS